MAEHEGVRLECPSCGAQFSAGERFCPGCEVPLAFPEAASDALDGDDRAAAERRKWARKIKPQLAEGRLVRAAGARNLTEAEFIQSLLLEAGVPSLLRRTPGFDVPDFLAAGPREILVPESGLQTAREVLLEAELIPPPGDRVMAAGAADASAHARWLLGEGALPLLGGLISALLVGTAIVFVLLAVL